MSFYLHCICSFTKIFAYRHRLMSRCFLQALNVFVQSKIDNYSIFNYHDDSFLLHYNKEHDALHVVLMMTTLHIITYIIFYFIEYHTQWYTNND